MFKGWRVWRSKHRFKSSSNQPPCRINRASFCAAPSSRQVDLPVFYGGKMRRKMKAGAGCEDLRARCPHYYATATRLHAAMQVRACVVENVFMCGARCIVIGAFGVQPLPGGNPSPSFVRGGKPPRGATAAGPACAMSRSRPLPSSAKLVCCSAACDAVRKCSPLPCLRRAVMPHGRRKLPRLHTQHLQGAVQGEQYQQYRIPHVVQAHSNTHTCCFQGQSAVVGIYHPIPHESVRPACQSSSASPFWLPVDYRRRPPLIVCHGSNLQ
jgi:hypothetical protein